MPNQLKNGQEVISSAMPNQLPENFLDIFFSVGFTHHYSIASKCNDFKEAFFYLSKVAAEFWDYRRLEKQIAAKLYFMQGTLPNNFKEVIPQSDIRSKALQSFKDEYLLDFINIEDPDFSDERLLENEIVRNIKRFILSIGSDFAFMGNQYRLIVEEQEYFIDLLFFNRRLQCLVAFEILCGIPHNNSYAA